MTLKNQLITIVLLHALYHITSMYLLHKNLWKILSNKTVYKSHWTNWKRISINRSLHAHKFSNILTNTSILKINFSFLDLTIIINLLKVCYSIIFKTKLLDYYLHNIFCTKAMYITWEYWWELYLLYNWQMESWEKLLKSFNHPHNCLNSKLMVRMYGKLTIS